MGSRPTGCRPSGNFPLILVVTDGAANDNDDENDDYDDDDENDDYDDDDESCGDDDK